MLKKFKLAHERRLWLSLLNGGGISKPEMDRRLMNQMDVEKCKKYVVRFRIGCWSLFLASA